MVSRQRKIQATLIAKEDVSDGLAVFRFELARDFAFSPGQYATLWLTHRDQTVSRPYSIASSPGQTRGLEFYIHRVEEGGLTPSLWNPEILDGLLSNRGKTSLAVTGPEGRFLLDPTDLRDLVLIASGTGLAPFMSMIRKMNENFLATPESSQRRTLYLIHGVSNSAQLGYREELQNLARSAHRDPLCRLILVYLPTVSRPLGDPSWSGLKGRAESLFNPDTRPASAEINLQENIRSILRALLRPESHAIYVCGHRGTLENVVRFLSPLGFKPDVDIKGEPY